MIRHSKLHRRPSSWKLALVCPLPLKNLFFLSCADRTARRPGHRHHAGRGEGLHLAVFLECSICASTVGVCNVAAAMSVCRVICLCETLGRPEPLDHPRGDTPVVPTPRSSGLDAEGGRDAPAVTVLAGRVVSPRALLGPDPEPRPRAGVQAPGNGARSLHPSAGQRQTRIFDSPSPPRLRMSVAGRGTCAGTGREHCPKP